MIDISEIGNASEIDGNDFVLTVGNVDDVSTWIDAPEPSSITVRPIDEDGDSTPEYDRITLTFDAGLIVGKWLGITLLANTDTGIPINDTFYFGNAPCDTGNSLADANVTPADAANLRSESTVYNWRNSADTSVVYDFNRDGRVNAFDSVNVRFNYTDAATALKLISPTVSPQQIPPTESPLLPQPLLATTNEKMVQPQQSLAMINEEVVKPIVAAYPNNHIETQLETEDHFSADLTTNMPIAYDEALSELQVDEVPIQTDNLFEPEDLLIDNQKEGNSDESELADEFFSLIGDEIQF